MTNFQFTMESLTLLLSGVEEFTSNLILKEVPPHIVYHDLLHTQEVAEAVCEIGLQCGLDTESIKILQISAWFHDTGHCKTALGHEEISAIIAENYLKDLDRNLFEKIKGCILATKMPQNPQNLLQQIICDADLFSLGTPCFYDRSMLLKKEWEFLDNKKFSDIEFCEQNIRFLQQHQYFTPYGKTILTKGKELNILSEQNRLKDLKKNV